MRVVWNPDHSVYVAVSDGGSLWQETLTSDEMEARFNSLNPDMSVDDNSPRDLLERYIIPEPIPSPVKNGAANSTKNTRSGKHTVFRIKGFEDEEEAFAEGQDNIGGGRTISESQEAREPGNENDARQASFVVITTTSPPSIEGFRITWKFVCTRQYPSALADALTLPLIGSVSALAQALRSLSGSDAVRNCDIGVVGSGKGGERMSPDS